MQHAMVHLSHVLTAMRDGLFGMVLVMKQHNLQHQQPAGPWRGPVRPQAQCASGWLSHYSYGYSISGYHTFHLLFYHPVTNQERCFKCLEHSQRGMVLKQILDYFTNDTECVPRVFESPRITFFIVRMD